MPLDTSADRNTRALAAREDALRAKVEDLPHLQEKSVKMTEKLMKGRNDLNGETVDFLQSRAKYPLSASLFSFHLCPQATS